MAEVVDDLTFVKSVATDVFNHAPAKLFANTGTAQFGRPSMGAWVTYGIGSESADLPGFVVLQSGPRGPRGGAVNWGSGFLPSAYQGVPLRSGGEPILNLSTPAGISAASAATGDRRRRRTQPGPSRRDDRPRDRHADHRLRDRVADADQCAGIDRPRIGNARDAQALRRRARQAVVCQQLPARPPAGRARRALRAALSHRLGPPRRPRPDA